MSVTEILSNCTVDGLVVKLPSIQLDRKSYVDVKGKLEKIGGKWKGGKIQGFVFDSDPSDLLQDIAGGANRNIKKEFQFFATPDDLADKIVSLADLRDNQDVLEPSAGQGAIIKAIHRIDPSILVDCYELMPDHHKYLSQITNCRIEGYDFLKENTYKYDRVVANPPFSKNQDIDHVLAMYNCLRNGGRLVSIMSNSWFTGTQKKQIDFKQFLSEVNAEIINLPNETFRESGTMVGGKIVIINK